MTWLAQGGDGRHRLALFLLVYLRSGGAAAPLPPPRLRALAQALAQGEEPRADGGVARRPLLAAGLAAATATPFASRAPLLPRRRAAPRVDGADDQAQDGQDGEDADRELGVG